MRKTLYLIDTSSMYFRAFYAIRPLSNSKGMPTNALYGFLTMSLKLLREVKPEYIAYCFDRKEPSFRKELDVNYKANRSEMPEDLIPQVPYIRKIVEAMGIAALELPQYEADDIIGMLAKLAEKKGFHVVIVSSDKDFGQLVNSHITIYDIAKDIKYDEKGVEDKLGVKPTQVIDYMALVGDTSDNIPGIKGIGPKGAAKLIHEYQTLDGIYENIEKIKNPSMKQKLLEGKESAYLSQKLVTIVTENKLPIEDVEEFKTHHEHKAELKALLQELEFRTLQEQLFGKNSSQELVKISDTDTVAEASKIIKKPVVNLAEQIVPSKKADVEVSVSAEKRDISVHRVTLQGLEHEVKPMDNIWSFVSAQGLAIGKGHRLFLIDEDPQKVGYFLADKQVSWFSHDVKELWKTLRVQADLSLLHCGWDSMLASYVVRARGVGTFEEVYRENFQEDPDTLSAENLYLAHLKLKDLLEGQLSPWQGHKVLHEYELPLVPVLFGMERKGVLLDTTLLNKQSKELLEEIKHIEKQIHEEVGEVFNIASPKQLGHILFEKLKMPTAKKTKSGYSTDSEVLEGLSKDFPICKKLIEFRELSKLRSTYVEALPQLVNPETHRIHTHFNQALTSTGRLSSGQPNLQNIPIRTQRGNDVRAAFIAENGCQLLSADYSQIELRVLAHITGDPGLCEAFEKNLDIHAATASQVFEVDLDQVTPDLRRKAKAINFGIAYGMGAYSLAEDLGVSPKEASAVIAQYFNRFKKVADYMNDIVQFAKSNGYVETITGRRRYLEELRSSNMNIRKFGERAAINAPMQGTASDIVKKAMIDLHLKTKGDLILQVHDELLYEVRDQDILDVQKQVQEKMESVMNLKVPLKVNVASAKSWRDAH